MLIFVCFKSLSQREEKKQKTTGKSWTETKRTSRRIRLITTYIKYTLCSDRELSPRFFFFFCSLLPPSGRCKKLQRLVWYLPRLLLCSLNPAAPALRLRANTVCKQLEVFAFLHFWHQPQGEGKKKQDERFSVQPAWDIHIEKGVFHCCFYLVWKLPRFAEHQAASGSR